MVTGVPCLHSNVVSLDLSLSCLDPQGAPGKDGIPGVRGDKGDIGFTGPRGLKVSQKGLVLENVGPRFRFGSSGVLPQVGNI